MLVEVISLSTKTVNLRKDSNDFCFIWISFIASVGLIYIYTNRNLVHPKFYGNGMQKNISERHYGRITKENSKYNHICFTIVPFNILSFKNKFAQGWEIAALKDKYSGVCGMLLWRFCIQGKKQHRKVLKLLWRMILMNSTNASGRVSYQGYDTTWCRLVYLVFKIK